MTSTSSPAAQHPSFTAFRKDNTFWTIREDAVALLPGNLLQLLHRPEQHPGLSLLRENNVRASFFLKHPSAGELFVKRYKMRGLRDVIKYMLLPSKAAAEWRTLRRCAESGLPVPCPIAVAEKKSGPALEDSCLVVEALTGALPLNEYFERLLPTPSPASAQKMRMFLTASLSHLARAIHSRGIFYRDLHAGNILIRSAPDGTYELFLIDLHRALFPVRLMQWMQVRDLARLCNSLPESAVDHDMLLRQYCEEAGCDEAAFRFLIAEASRKMEARRLKSRGKRCMKNSTAFEVCADFRQQYCGRRDFGRHACRKALQEHHGAVSRKQGQILKQSKNSVITFHEKTIGLPVDACVKQYQYRGIRYVLKSLFAKTRARKSWIAGNAFLVRGISTPLPLVLQEQKFGPFVIESFLITEWLAGARELNDYVTLLDRKSASAEVKDAFIKALAGIVRNLHEKGVYHADLKSTNILVQELPDETWRFSFIDLDRVAFRDSLSFQERANNLAQINASISRRAGAKERLKFFFFYAKGTHLFRERKKYYQEILKISRTKNTAPFGVIFSDR